MEKNELLKLDNQLCFPLYAAAMSVTRLYRPLLEPLGLTYTQYITMMYLWEKAPCPINMVSAKLMLNTNTLTPLLKKLEKKGFISRMRSQEDERIVLLDITPAGWELRGKCECVPLQLMESVSFSKDDAVKLKELLSVLVASIQKNI
ncbi:MarR family winged helix-turn-helix transcriptional regulator [Seleniivibrio woodruffii]|uniref:MarR family winged helix-turn-helix transcriptional regulator n=1 Tax=Seleniivibrio woodruffii TaxID=1078050 RepID=UPI00240A6E05|nr:MarR family winged helix-turn-helix transcriptional regulator [Seleniivibrio woodruffii]